MSVDRSRSRVCSLLGILPKDEKFISLGDLLHLMELKLSEPVTITETMRWTATTVLEAQSIAGFHAAAILLAKEILGICQDGMETVVPGVPLDIRDAEDNDDGMGSGVLAG